MALGNDSYDYKINGAEQKSTSLTFISLLLCLATPHPFPHFQFKLYSQLPLRVNHPITAVYLSSPQRRYLFKKQKQMMMAGGKLLLRDNGLIRLK